MYKLLNKENIFILLIILISIFLSISYSYNQQATDGGLALSGLVEYPDNLSIMKIYYINLYSFLHQFSGFFLKLNLSIINTDRLLLFFATLFYFTGIYLTVKSISRSSLLGFLVALSVIIFRKNFGNVDYPTEVFGKLSFSSMGLSIVTLIYGLIANRNLFLAGFFSIFLICIHAIIGVWITGILFFSFLLQKFIWKKFFVDKKFIYGIFLGFLIVILSFSYYYLNKIDVSFLKYNEEIYATYMELWETHRIKGESFFQSLHYIYLIKSLILILVCFLFLKYLHKKNDLCQLMFIMVFSSAVISFVVYILYKLNPNLYPSILIAIMPTRFILMHSVIGIPIIISFFYILFKNFLINKNFKPIYSLIFILGVLFAYSVMHYKNILVRTNEFITNLSYTSYGHQNQNFLESVKEMEINGHILTNNDWTSAMVLRKSLKPVFFQIGIMDMIPYFPYASEYIKKIMEKVYDIPFNNPPIKNLLKIPDEIIKKNYEKKTKADWQEISKEFNIGALVVPSSWKIDLNLEFNDKDYSYYKISN